MFSYEFYEIFKNNFFYRTPLVAANEYNGKKECQLRFFYYNHVQNCDYTFLIGSSKTLHAKALVAKSFLMFLQKTL